ncbi:MAG: helix-turn-helix domain-containing protein [Erysipelotrichaceae bacterium]
MDKNSIFGNQTKTYHVLDLSYIDSTYLRDFRMKLGYTQSAFAIILGVTKKSIEKWEQGVYPVSDPIRRLIYLMDKLPEVREELYPYK